MADQALRLGGATLTRFAEIVHTALIEMRGTTSPRLVLELLCARMLLPDASADSAALLQRLERLERRYAAASPADGALDQAAEPADVCRGADGCSASARRSRPRRLRRRRPRRQRSRRQRPRSGSARTAAGAGEPPTPAAPAAESRRPAPEPASAAAPGELDAAALRRLWPEVLEIVKQASRRTRALLDNAQITDGGGELVTLAAPRALARMIAEDSNTSVLRRR